VLKAIRAKCLDCCYQETEVRKCTAVGSPAWPYRIGSNPLRKKKELSEEQRELLREVATGGSAKTGAKMTRIERTVLCLPQRNAPPADPWGPIVANFSPENSEEKTGTASASVQTAFT
jgi:hypothetical protein